MEEKELNGVSGINKQQAKEIKESILRHLCDDFTGNQAIFDRNEGYACFNGTDLKMVMDKVVNGIYRCIGIGNVAGMNQLGISKQDVEFLRELQHELLTQDHICQASPRFWVVQGTVRDYGIDGDYDCNGSELIWDTERFAEDVDEAMKKLKDEYYDIFQDKGIAIRKRDGYWQFSEDRGDNTTTIFDLDDIKDFMEDKLGYDNIDVVNYRNVDKNFENTMFLTNRECKAHIKANYYHYPKDAHSYAMTAWRSSEVSKVWDILEKINCDELLKLAE